MVGSRKKSTLTRLTHSPIVLFLLLAFSGFLAMSVYERYTVALEMKARRDAVEEEYETLKARRGELTTQVNLLQTPEGAEAELRRNFDVAAPGEQVVVIYEDNALSREGDMTAATSTKSTSLWERILPW